jgi:hypothetical protein
VPVDSSRITVTYTYHGTPFITSVNPLKLAYIDGGACSRGVHDVVYQTIADETLWPWYDHAPCNLVNVPIRICDSPSRCSDEFFYTGEDIQVNIPQSDVAGAATATARFEHNGIPQLVSIVDYSYLHGGMPCEVGGSRVPATVGAVALWWPSTGDCGAAGTQIVARFNTVEFGLLQGAFTWNLADLDYDVDTGTPPQTPSPSPQPNPASQSAEATPTQLAASPIGTATPAELPRSGGMPVGQRLPGSDVFDGVIALSGAVCAWRFAAPRRKG